MFEEDPLVEHGIQMGLLPQRLSSLLPHELEDVQGHLLVPIVVRGKLVFNQVHLPEEDVDHSQFFRYFAPITFSGSFYSWSLGQDFVCVPDET
jgi:hypothetical protein